SDLIQFIKTHPDELAALSKPMDFENLIVKILDGLDDDYKSILDVLNGRNTTVSFDKLHEKLLNKALSLRLQQSISFPLPGSTNVANSQHNLSCFGTTPLPPQWTPNFSPAGALVSGASPVAFLCGRTPSRPYRVVASGVIFKVRLFRHVLCSAEMQPNLQTPLALRQPS
ncbi:hypothetical protein PanWU01x14_011250, partial [Parasponia andersonii]